MDSTSSRRRDRPDRPDNHEFGVIRLRELPSSIPSCDGPHLIFSYWMANITSAPWYNPDVECLCAIHLNTRRRATGFHLVAIGTLDTVLISPREVFRAAIVRSASAIVIAHNHPSGDPTPSAADIRATKELEQGAQLLKIPLLDHIIVGSPGPEQPRAWASLRELGLLNF